MTAAIEIHVAHIDDVVGFAIDMMTTEQTLAIGPPMISLVREEGYQPESDFERILLDFYEEFGKFAAETGSTSIGPWWYFLCAQVRQLADPSNEDTMLVIQDFEKRGEQYYCSLNDEKTMITDAERARGITELVMLQARMLFEFALVAKAVTMLQDSKHGRFSGIRERVNASPFVNTTMETTVGIAAIPVASAIRIWNRFLDIRDAFASR